MNNHSGKATGASINDIFKCQTRISLIFTNASCQFVKFVSLRRKGCSLTRPNLKPALALLLSALAVWSSGASDLMLWYRQPAKNAIDEGLPIGNARLGALVLGGVEQERLVLNEDSLWTGDENPSGNYDTMGAYQALGNIVISFAGGPEATGYRRELDLDQAVTRVSYQLGDAKYEREFFCSHPAGVLVGRFSANKPGRYTCNLSLQDAHGAPIEWAGNQATVAGRLSNGLRYEWQVLVLPRGGQAATQGASLQLNGCDGFVLLAAAGTDYAMNPATRYRGEDPHPAVTARITNAATQTYDALRAEHVRDFQALFHRVELDLGPASENQRALPTDLRKLEAFKTTDPELERLLFQYGRYLLISCSRPGGLPANLQGLWNDSNDPPWHCDYHANINIQMNYWPAEVANLAECHLPFLDLVVSQLPPWRRAAAQAAELKTPSGAMTTRGFALRTSHNIMGGLGWKWDKTANAWYCRHFWEHYDFRPGQRIPAHSGLPCSERDLPILGRPFKGIAGRSAGGAARVVARARTGRGRGQLQPGDRVGPVQQLCRGL